MTDAPTDSAPASLAKFNMIEQQIRPWEVIDNRVLATLDRLDRAHFVPEDYRGLAYADCQIPLAGGARMLPPTIEGRMLQALLIEVGDSALEIGSGAGYVTACLAELAGQVLSIDARADIVELARARVDELGYDNVAFEQLALAELDRPQTADAIAVTASLASVPDNLRAALKIGGRLFVVVGEPPAMEALLITRFGENDWQTLSLFETVLPRLGG